MTLYHLYTIWALVIATVLVIRLVVGPRCAHPWELVDKVEFCSQAEEARKLHLVINHAIGSAVDDALRRSVTVEMRCPRCGACKVLRITS
jgi:hypothetical protein